MDKSIKECINTMLNENDLADRPSLYQMQCFILHKEPTIQGKLHQCLLELKSRRESLEAIELEIEDQQDRLELIDISLIRKTASIGDDDLGKREQKVIIRQHERQKLSIVNHINKISHKKKMIEEECQFFFSAFNQLLKRESLKQWDDVEVQKEYWGEKLRQEVNLRLLLRQLPDVETMRSVLALHDDAPLKKKTVEMLQDYNAKIANIQQQDIVKNVKSE